MWCDDFDGDLYKLVPEARGILAPAAEVRLYTTSHTTHGQINLPSCWEFDGGKHVCFFGFEKIAPQPRYCCASWPVVACTFEEIMRDLWCHHMEARVKLGNGYEMLLRGFVPPGYYPDEGDGEGDVWLLFQAFEDLLWHSRGDRQLTATQVAYRKHVALRVLERATHRIQDMACRAGLC